MERNGVLFFAIAIVIGLIDQNLGTAINTSSIHYYDIVGLSGMTKTSDANLTAISWAHAVNSQKELEDALNSNIQMIEADIVLGKINNTGPDLPVMGHPPAVTSDISLQTFLNTILDYNNNTEEKKGVKLDFKSIEVFEGSLEILREMWPLMTYPIWLNADIIKGPVNQTETVPVDPDRFFAGCRDFDNAVLSIGWTTQWGNNYTEGSYTESEVDEMIEAIKNNNITNSKQPITFPVRAGIAANSETQLHQLVNSVNDTNESSLTIWSSANDNVDIKKLRNLIFSFGLNRIYLDVPEEVSSKLELDKGPSNAAAVPSLVNFTVISLSLLAASFVMQKIFV